MPDEVAHNAAPGPSTAPVFDGSGVLMRALASLQQQVKEMRQQQQQQQQQTEDPARLVRRELANPPEAMMDTIQRATLTGLMESGLVPHAPRTLPAGYGTGKHRVCASLRLQTGQCAGLKAKNKNLPGACMVRQRQVEMFRKSGTAYMELLDVAKMEPKEVLKRLAICKPCHDLEFGTDSGSGSLMLSHGGNKQCECCNGLRSSSNRNIKADGTCLQCVYPNAEGNHVPGFLDRWIRPLRAALECHGIHTTIHWQGMSLPEYGAVDVLVKFTMRNAVSGLEEVKCAYVLEIDTQQHSGAAYDTDPARGEGDAGAAEGHR